MTQIIGIAVKAAKRAPMKELSSVMVTLANGLEGDCRGSWDPRFGYTRQVTLLSLEQWQNACKKIGVELPWYMRRANLCVEGLTFGPEHAGKKLFIGKVELEITGETDPCERMNAIRPGLKDALLPRWMGGVTCRVLRGGIVTLNSPIGFVRR